MQDTPVQVLHDPERARLVVHDLRRRVLEIAREPVSAQDVGERLGEPRQKVNYHLRALAGAGLLKLVRSEKRRGLTENYYRATAGAYLLSPGLLGDLAPDPERERDRFSAAHLLALTARTQTELGRVMEEAARDGKRVPTLSLDVTLRFANAAARRAFTEALHETVLRLAEAHSVPESTPGARTYRLLVASHPKPKESARHDA